MSGCANDFIEITIEHGEHLTNRTLNFGFFFRSKLALVDVVEEVIEAINMVGLVLSCIDSLVRGVLIKVFLYISD